MKTKEMIAIVLLLIGILMMTSGLHIVDNAWNMAYIEHISNMHLQDCSMLGCANKENIYTNGLSLIMLSLIFFILPVMVLMAEFNFSRRRRPK